MRSYVTNEGTHFVVKLLWKSENSPLDDNYNMALQRLTCFERKLDREPALRENVNKHIDEIMKKGYVRKLELYKMNKMYPRKWYLPIFTVRNLNKPNKIRMVWDAAAKYNGVSLNDCPDKGPDMLISLIEVLYKFRVGKFGICGDISEMFHRVHMNAIDQQAQRFLWRKVAEQVPGVYVLQVLSFGASCSPALAQFVKDENALRFIHKFPRAVKSIIERHYVDELLDSVDSEEEAVKLALEICHIHKAGNFHIKNWLSNSKAVIEAMGEINETQDKQKQFCRAGPNDRTK